MIGERILVKDLGIGVRIVGANIEKASNLPDGVTSVCIEHQKLPRRHCGDDVLLIELSVANMPEVPHAQTLKATEAKH